MDNGQSDIIKEDDSDVEIVRDEEGEMPDLWAKLKRLKAERAICDKERKEYLDGWQRAKADFINYKRDEGKRFEEMAHFMRTGLLQDLLPVLDSFEMAMAHQMAQETEKGVMLIRSQLEDILKKHGLERILVSCGDAFNPEKHESIGEVKSDAPAGAIAEILQQGYSIAGRVVRPARVKIVKS